MARIVTAASREFIPNSVPCLTNGRTDGTRERPHAVREVQGPLPLRSARRLPGLVPPQWLPGRQTRPDARRDAGTQVERFRQTFDPAAPAVRFRSVFTCDKMRACDIACSFCLLD